MRVLAIGWGHLCDRCHNDFTPSIDQNRMRCIFDEWCDECYCSASLSERLETVTSEDVAQMLREKEAIRKRLKAQKEVKKQERKRKIKKYNYRFVEDLDEPTEREKEASILLEKQREQLELIFNYSDNED